MQPSRALPSGCLRPSVAPSKCVPFCPTPAFIAGSRQPLWRTRPHRSLARPLHAPPHGLSEEANERLVALRAPAR
eukprot:scaffold228216_cov32-Tisochrysis_lutea.AAC.1